MPIKLSDIAITHISLVKAGANGKEVIYKSAANEGEYENSIAIKKTDNEKGVIYGIVYAPDEVDSQGDFATSEEIEKAAYAFMKARNTTNVDVDHSFNNEAAFVAESWIVKGGDSIFPNEPIGSWAVAIKLEDEDLKALAKSGELAGISMAGTAQKTEVEKGEGGVGQKAFTNFFEAFANVATDMWVDFGAFIKKSKGEEVNMEDFAKVVKEKLQEATAAAGEGLKKQDQKIEALEKSTGELSEEVQTLKKENEALAKENRTLKDENKTLVEKVKTQGNAIEKLQADTKEVTKAVKESKQKTTVKKADDKTTKGVL